MGLLVEVKNKRVSAILSVTEKSFKVLDCTNSANCRVLGISCSASCPLIADAKRFVRGWRTRHRVEVLS
ncbi:MAG: hypothetical protein ABWW66_08185 [Archaeoglobaceae archaeon]